MVLEYQESVLPIGQMNDGIIRRLYNTIFEELKFKKNRYTKQNKFYCMYLSDRDIRLSIDSGTISISDFDVSRLQPASYDIRLGNRFLVVKDYSVINIDPINHILPEYEELIVTAEQGLILRPGVTVLGTSIEKFGSEKYLIQLSGKSSLARIGLIVHNTA